MIRAAGGRQLSLQTGQAATPSVTPVRLRIGDQSTGVLDRQATAGKPRTARSGFARFASVSETVLQTPGPDDPRS